MNKSPYMLWSIWPSLSYLTRLFVLTLAVVAVHSIISAVIALKGARALAASHENHNSIQPRITALHRRCVNLRQILGAAFFLFGFLFFLGLPNATITLGDGPRFPAFEILSNFVLHFIYAANVFFVFLMLHLIQWIVSSRVSALTGKLNP